MLKLKSNQSCDCIAKGLVWEAEAAAAKSEAEESVFTGALKNLQ